MWLCWGQGRLGDAGEGSCRSDCLGGVPVGVIRETLYIDLMSCGTRCCLWPVSLLSRPCLGVECAGSHPGLRQQGVRLVLPQWSPQEWGVVGPSRAVEQTK